MRSRTVRIQLAAFVIIAVLGIIYVGARYARIDKLLGFRQYPVTVQLPDSGGVFPNAEVTYRGVPVGRVGDMTLTRDGINVQLLIDSSAPKIPASTKAAVADRSAIGEQYVDLRPETDNGPYLESGSVIPVSRTKIPTPVQDVLANVNSLAKSVPLDDLHTAVAQLGVAFDGQGDNLQSLVDSVTNFSETFKDSLPQTLALIRDGRTFLDTQAEQANAIGSYSVGLQSVTAQLRDSDPDVRRLVDTGLDFSGELGKLITDSGTALTTDLTNLHQTMVTVAPKAFNLKPLLQLLPGLSIGGSGVAPGDGTVHLGLVLETNNPVSCTVGYESTYQMLAQMKAQNPNFDDSRDDIPFNTNAGCKVPEGNATDVRGQKSVIYDDPSVPQPWDNVPKTDPDKLNLTPIATQLSTLIGVVPKR
ncbi:MCE family protein [Skermania sp. ID1734]|uniref:MCE family protein n=1 Tax=Skermania sp. ID1734 TaxID=2597516 RepID=UPI00117C60CB|nr:MlaD family protein [Skermania sp. ID1734]TSD95087.1 MCE family protein [Skermania sp. ID1734]